MAKKWWVLLVVCAGTFMLLLDVTIVVVALPDIQTGLHTTFADVQWVVDAYAPHPRVVAPHRRHPRRPVRSAAPLRDRAGDLHRWVAAVRIGAVTPDADPLESPSGSRRSDPVRNLARTARPDVPRPRTRRRLRCLGCGHRDLDGARTDPRRDHHHRHQLAGNLLGQHPHRNRGDRDRAVAARRVEAPSGVATGLGRIRHADGRAGRPRLRPHPRR